MGNFCGRAAQTTRENGEGLQAVRGSIARMVKQRRDDCYEKAIDAE
jgi:hypothetical protein